MSSMLNNFRYYFKQSATSLLHNLLMTMTSIFTVVCCMLILSTFLLLTININYIADQLQGQCELQAFISATATEEEFLSVAERIRQIDNVAEVVPFGKQDQLADMREMFEDDASILDGYEKDNPFRDSYKITLTDLSKIDETIQAVSAVSGVQDVSNKRDAVENILNLTRGIKNGSMWGMILLSLVSVFIIANTIKITVFSRRKEINVMKFVGATDWFIRWPFVIEGILIGIIGALVAFGLVSWGYTSILHSFSEQINLFRFKLYSEIWAMLLGVCVLLGSVIGAIGSGLAVRKHLHV